MRRLYSRRRAMFVGALRHFLSDDIVIGKADCGLHISIELAKSLDVRGYDVELSREAERKHLTLIPLSSFYLRPESGNGFVLGFASLDEASMMKSVNDLSSVVRSDSPIRAS